MKKVGNKESLKEMYDEGFRYWMLTPNRSEKVAKSINKLSRRSLTRAGAAAASGFRKASGLARLRIFGRVDKLERISATPGALNSEHGHEEYIRHIVRDEMKPSVKDRETMLFEQDKPKRRVKK